MKKIFAKHDLFKIILCFVLLVAILTWIIPVGQYTGSEMYVREISRLGIVDLFASNLYSFSTTLNQITFILVLGGFYGVLSQLDCYRRLISKIVGKLKGKEIIFIMLMSFVIAGLASITSDLYQLLLFVPFIITIILNLKLDKFNAISTTIGSILIGKMGATYNIIYQSLTSSNATSMNFSVDIITKVAIFVLAFLLLNFFNFLHAKKILNEKKKNDFTADDKFSVELIVDKKIGRKANSGSKIWPLIVILSFLLVIQILAFVPWDTVFNIKIFTSFHEWLYSIKIKDYAIFAYIIGNESIGVVKPFGNWTLFNLEIVMILAILLIAIVYSVSFDKLIEDFITGIKKVARLALIVVLVNCVFVITVWNPIVPTIVDWIVGLTKHFNIYLASLATLIASAINVDLEYVAYSIGEYLNNLAGKHSNLVPIIMNSMHGLSAFIAPTSVFLMSGLAYLNISYKDWMKYIWRFLVGITVGLLIIFTIVRYL